MLRVLFSTDSHISNVNPSSRCDDYLKSSIEELEETLDIAVKENCDLWLHGGDLFDIAEPNGICRNLVIRTLTDGKYSKLRKVCLIGNHDVKYNMMGIHNSALGTLFDADILEHAPELPEFGIMNHDYRSSIEDEIRAGLICNSQYPIHVVHGSIVLAPYHGNYILTKEIETNSKTQLILAGHIHFPLKGKTKNGTKFLNPGSITRNKLNTESVGRIPQVVLLEYDIDNISNMSISTITLKSSKPSDEIFKHETVLLQKAEEMATTKFIQQVVQSNDFWSTEKDRTKSLRNSGLKKGIKEDIVQTAIDAVDEINNLKDSNKQ